VATEESDLWAFGCLVYAVLVGRSPFNAGTSYLTFEKVRSVSYEIPPFVLDEAADLIRRLLVIDPAQRLGAGTFKEGYELIRRHPFFAEIVDWGTLPTQEIVIVPSQEAVKWKGAIMRQAEERENAIKAKVIQTEKVTFIGPQDEITADLVVTDNGRVIVKNGEEVLASACIGEEFKIRHGEGMLYLENGEDHIRVKMDELRAHELKHVLLQVLDNGD
jgi:hypothetical protein